MAAPAIDTLQIFEDLQNAGVPTDQARAIAATLDQTLRTHFTTKADFDAHRAELKTELAEGRAELKTDIAELKAELAETRADLKTDIATLEARLIWRLLGGVAVLLTIHIALLKLI